MEAFWSFPKNPSIFIGSSGDEFIVDTVSDEVDDDCSVVVEIVVGDEVVVGVIEVVVVDVEVVVVDVEVVVLDDVDVDDDDVILNIVVVLGRLVDVVLTSSLFDSWPKNVSMLEGGASFKNSGVNWMGSSSISRKFDLSAFGRWILLFWLFSW